MMKVFRGYSKKTLFFSITIFFLCLILFPLGRFLLQQVERNRVLRLQEKARHLGPQENNLLVEKREFKGKMSWYFPQFPWRYYMDLPVPEEDGFIAVEKPAKSLRIFLIGSSSAAGSPFGPWASFLTHLKRILDSTKKGNVTLEFLNFGISGSHSSQAKFLAEELAPFRPDLIILYLGHNECKIDHSECLSSTRLYKENVAQILETAKGIQGNVLLLSQISNQLFPPRGPYPHFFSYKDGTGVYSSTSENEKKLLRSFFKMTASESGTVIRDVLRENPASDIAHYFWGVSQMLSEDFSGARAHLNQSMELDPEAFRARPSQSQVLSSLQDPKKGIYFVNTEKYISSLLPDGIIDGRVVIDEMHPNLLGHKLLAQALIELFFKKNNYRSDLFDYGKLDLQSTLWNQKTDIESYLRIVERFCQFTLPKPLIMYSPDFLWKTVFMKKCVSALADHYSHAENPLEKRIHKGWWEIFYYYGIFRNDPFWQDMSKELCPFCHQNLCNLSPGASCRT